MKSFVEFLSENMNVNESMAEPNAFVILKPEFLTYDQEWKNLIKDRGWNFINSEKITLTPEQAKDVYEPHKDKDFYDDLCNYMTSGECICCTCHKACEDPIEDMKTIKDEVRDKWGIDDMKNVMHSSDSLENVKRESEICLR